MQAKAIERGHKIEELQKRLNESEALRIRYLEKLTALKDQVNCEMRIKVPIIIQM